ncbi:MAG: ATP-binding protein, partial [Polyangia bacterium]
MEQGSRAAVARERIREPGPGPEPRPRAPGRAAAVRGALHVLAPFPRSVPTFVGRSDELARAHGLLVRAPALLVYGVPGIGKSEFVYRLIDELREDPAWRRARPVLLQAQRGQSAASLVSLLRLALEGPRRSPLHPGAAPRPPAGSDGEGLSAQALAGLVHALELRPHLVFLDDAHHLEEGALLALLSYLSRRVSKSRILVASRAELPLSPEGPLPAVIRLPPLAAAETAALASQLVEQLGLEPLSGDVFGVTRGSPYHVQRVLMRSRGLPVSGEDPLLVTLRGLSPAARRLLLLCRILAGRMGELLGEGRTELPAIPELPELRAAQWELGRYFLVQAPRYTVHELVWEAVAPAFSPEDHAQAHRTAARLCLSRSAAGREPVHVPEPQPLDVLAALQHLLACGDGAAAWSIFVSSRRLLTAPSLEPLLLVVLAELQQSCPERAEDVVIFCAQRLLRQARIGEARARLVALQRERGGLLALGGQALRLLGHAAARAGELAAAAEPLDAACRARPDDPAVRLELAWIAALQGDHGFAACRLEEATALVVLPLERVRLARQRALCALLAERPAGPQLA